MVLQHHLSHPTTPAGPGSDTVIAAAVPLHTERGISASAELAAADELGMTVNDPDAALDFSGLWRWYIVEDECPTGDQLVWNGYVGEQDIDRGEADDWEPWGRRWSLSLTECNSIIDFRVIHGADGDRPAETAKARLEWLLASDYLDTVHDHGLIDWDGLSMFQLDANDYHPTGRPSAVLGDIAAMSGFNYYVRYNGSAGDDEFAMYDPNTSDLDSSMLQISNLGTDIDDADPETQTTWPYEPIPGARLGRKPDRIAAGCVVQYAGGALYGYRYATAYEYAFRDQVAPSASVKTAAVAQKLLDHYLADNATQDERITQVRIHLPASRLNAVKQGQRIQCKGLHWAGLKGWTTDYRWCRVLQKAFSRPDNEGQSIYDVDLVLSPTSPEVHQVILSTTGGYPAVPLVNGDPPRTLVFSGAMIGAMSLKTPSVVQDTDGYAVRVADPACVNDADDPFGDPCYVEEIVIPTTLADGTPGAGRYRATWEEGMPAGLGSPGAYGSLADIWDPSSVLGHALRYMPNGADTGIGACLMTDGSFAVSLCVNGEVVRDITGTVPGTNGYNQGMSHWSSEYRFAAGDVITMQAQASGIVYMGLSNSIGHAVIGFQQGVFVLTRLGD
jgi:hypothetical protein